MATAMAPQRPLTLSPVDLIDNLAERVMRSGRRVGLVVGYVAGGEEWVRGYGRCGTGAHDRPDGGTIFEIGSITKVFTGLLLADLAERGIVGRDDSLARYLPASAAVPTSGGREITLADLASHTSGLRRTPRGCWAGGWLTGTTRMRRCRPRTCTRAWPGRDCGAGRANGPDTRTSAPACWARRWPGRPASRMSSSSGSGSACL